MLSLDECSDILLRVLTEKIPLYEYFTELEKSWHICKSGREEEVRAVFEAKGIKVRYT